MSHIHLKIYNNDDNVNQCYRISPRRKNNNFNINDYVKNNNNLYGIIKDKNDNYIIVNWNDNTYERLQIPLINKNYLIRISKNEYSDNINYVDTIESQISPLQTSTVNTASSQDNFTKNNLTGNNHTESEQVIEKNAVKISKKELSAENNNKITQLINLALNKGIIDPDEVETEKLKLTAFDDEALKQYEEMLNNTSDEGEVISLSESQIDTSGLSPQEAEAQNMLHKLKHQRGISTMSRQKNVNVNDVNSRSLHDMEKTAITYMNTNNGQTINNSQVSLDDSLLQALSNNNYQNNNDISNSYQNNNSYQGNNNISDNNSFDIDNIDLNNNNNFNNTFSNNFDNNSDSNFNNNFSNNFSSDYNNYGNNSNSNNNVNNANTMSLDSIVEQIQRDNKSSFLKTPFNGLTKPLLINTSDNINPYLGIINSIIY